ncbi:hypothetical protein ACHAWX_002635 [Stephanocyclus meneghinianus]
MFSFPDYNYNRYAYSMRRPQPSPRSAYSMHPTLSSLMYSPFEYDYSLMHGRHQQQKEEERRKRMQRQQALEERQRQRQLDEMEPRDEEKRQRTMNTNIQNRANTSGLPFPPGTILPGKDGRLYRVVNRPSCLEQTSFENAKVDDSRSLSENYDTDTGYSSDSTNEKEHIGIDDIDDLHSENNSQAVKLISTDQTNLNPSMEKENNTIIKNKKHSVISLVVEDVPIEEDDELRDLHSVWRNRAPSPGQWMEPIDHFERQ